MMDKKNTHQELEKRVSVLERIFNLSLDMIGVGNLAGYFTEINFSFGRILGYTDKEFLAVPFIEFVHHEDIEETEKALAAAANGEKEIYIENRYKCKDGSYKWIDWKVLSLIQEDRFYAIGRDVTKRKNVENLLLKNKAELQAIVENSPTGITISDVEGHILRTNPAHQKIFGYSQAELETMAFSDFTHPDDIGKHSELFKKLLVGEILQLNMTKRFIHKDGHTIWAYVKLSLVLNEKMNPLFVIGMVEDISERKKEEMVKEALIEKLQNAIEEINTLQGIIPICMHCKQIRDDKGFWNKVEKYIEHHTGAKFSHGICPSCFIKFNPDIAE